MNLGRNEPCVCGSGKKYKKCCLGKAGSSASSRGTGAAAPDGAARKKDPAPAELNSLVGLFNTGRLAELEGLACLLLERHPESGFVWKVLGTALLVQGKDSLPALRKASRLLPGDAEAHYNMGCALMAQGGLAEAEAAYRRALQIRPDDADAHFNLGNVLLGLRRMDEAEASYRRALQIRPDFAEAYGNLGGALLERGRLAEAEASCRHALRIKPDYVLAHYNLGNILYEQKRMDEAEASYRHALQIKPGYAEAHNNLGKMLQDIGRLTEAEASYRQALQIKPEFSEASFNLANVLREMGRLTDAEISYRQALQINPDFAEAHCGLGKVLQDMGCPADAEASLERALQIKPDLAEAHGNLGALHMELGNIDKAEASLHKALEIKPEYVSERCVLAMLKKVQPGDKNLEALVETEAALRRGAVSLSNGKTINLHFALGKCYDDIGEHDKAFSHFLEGNKLKHAALSYDLEQAEQRMDTIMRNLDAAAIGRLRGGGNPSRLPVFVLGMPRSGTSLVEQIITSHPDVHGAGELYDLLAMAGRKIGDAAFPDNLRSLDQVRLAEWGAEYVAGLQRRAPDARHITDKMPQNFLNIGLIHLMLPNAKIIHVNRNPTDNCLSCFMTEFMYGHEYSFDLTSLGRYYLSYVRLMDHWRKVLPSGAFLDVQYEDVVADQEAQARRLIEYCGLEWNDACLDFHQNKRAVRTASVAQVRQPIYKSSVERWRPYGKFLGPLFDALGELAPKR